MAHAVPTTDSCGFAGCLTRASTVLFTELVYAGSVNATSGLPVNNYILPQLTDYFPPGNPLRSCTTASLVSYTAEARPALAKRQLQEPLAINTFPAKPRLTDSVTYSVASVVVDTSPAASGTTKTGGDGSTTQESGTELGTAATAATTSEPSQQSAQTQAGSLTSPSLTMPQASSTQAVGSDAGASNLGASSTGIPNTGASNTGDSNTEVSNTGDLTTGATGGATQSSDLSLGTMSQTVTGMAGNSSSTQASTWNYICSAEGCTLASNSESASGGSSAASSSAADPSQTASQGDSDRINLSRVLGGVAVLVGVMFAMA